MHYPGHKLASSIDARLRCHEVFLDIDNIAICATPVCVEQFEGDEREKSCRDFVQLHEEQLRDVVDKVAAKLDNAYAHAAWSKLLK